VKLALTGNTTSGPVVSASADAGVSKALIAVDRSRWYIRWLSGRVKTPTFCVFPVFSVAVMEKSCDACGDGEYYFRSGSSATEDASV
jgi:hypothetical protein